MKSYDVVVVGKGNAALCAALEARGYTVSDTQIAADAAWLLRDGFAARVGLA